MRLFFTIVDDWRSQRRDLWLEGDPATPVRSLAAILDPDGDPRIAAWWEGDRLLAADGRLGLEVHDGVTLCRRPARDRDPGPGGPPSPALVEFRAVAGPHAGTRWPLPSGRYLIGRSDQAAVNLTADPRVSRHHAVLQVSPGEIFVRDEGSAHGLRLDGSLVKEAVLAEGEPLQVGDSVLAWSPPAEDPAEVVRDGEGGLVFNRPPRMLQPRGAATVRFPGPAPARQGVNFPLMASIAPVVLGVFLALVVHQVQFLLFMLLSPVMLLSNYVTQRRGGARSYGERVRRHGEAVGRAEAELASAVVHETAARRRAAPDPAALAAVAAGPASTLWERQRVDDDFLVLRVGLADLPPSFTVEGRGPGGRDDGDGDGDRDDLTLRQVPALVQLPEDGVLGLAGDRQVCESLARALLVQAAVLHAPDDLTVTVLTGPNQHLAWDWARWLPHARDRQGRYPTRIGSTDLAVARLAAELAALVDERTSGGSGGPGPRAGAAAAGAPSHLVILDGSYRLGAIPAVTRILRRGADVGIYCVCLDDSERQLPEECRAVAAVESESSPWVALRTRRQARVTRVLADLVSVPTAEEVARHLAPLRLNRRLESGPALPTSVRLLDLLDLEPPAPDAVLARWKARSRSTCAVIGVAETGPLLVDLARDGPHGLVAGTTGSGKSELLQTLIASLAVANRPALMNFVLVDYKGGSAFKECGLLPHTVGLVTDLDAHLTERALASLTAELHRREIVLDAVGARDIEGYWRAATAAAPPLSRLVIVIDEFAALAEELPTFVDGLVDLARRGRSLGIHLILATQRPSGVVSAAIKTNTNLRIAMRVTDAVDSVDVIDSPLAARISKGVPGRGYLRAGHEELSEFQAARVGGRRPLTGAAGLEVHEVGWEELASPLPEPQRPALAADATDLSELVTAIRAADDRRGPAAPYRPWLEPLPERVVFTPAALAAIGTDPTGGGAPPGRTEPAPGVPSALAAPFGMEDHPGEQRRQLAAYDVERDGHLLAIGDPGSGRSTLLRTLTGSLAARARAADVHLYGIDCGNGALLPVAELPHCGAVVGRREPDRVDRLLTRLLAEVSGRQQILARGGFATIGDQRLAAAPGDRLPYVVIVLDRWEGFNAEFESLDNGRLVTSFLHLMREGPGAGIRVVVTGDRSVTSARFASLADRILMLRCNDRATYSVAGLNPRHLPDRIPTGRAFDARTGIEVQVALLDDDPSGPAQVAALRGLATAAAARDANLSEAARPEPVAALPAHVRLSDLLDSGPSHVPAGRPVVLVGVGGDRLTPQVLDLTRVGPGFVISGPPRSGRSNTLLVAARSLVDQACTVVAITARRSPLTGLRSAAGVAAVLDGRAAAPGDLQALLASLADGPVALLVDDAELLADSPIGDTLTDFCRSARDHGNALILAGTAGELGVFRGFIPEVRKSRSGLLLCPGGTADGEVLGARLPRTAVFSGPPGRGVLVGEGELQVVQVPYADAR
jgi:S-DNA-T family DNA segregation ATPase FtsK/SpoIIIE